MSSIYSEEFGNKLVLLDDMSQTMTYKRVQNLIFNNHKSAALHKERQIFRFAST
jgi:hypothetical protein